MTGLFTFLMKYRWGLLAGLLVLTALLAMGIGSLKVDNSINSWFTDEDPARASYELFLETYGNDDVVITLISDSLPFYHPARLESFASFAEGVKDLPGVSFTWSMADLPLAGTGLAADPLNNPLLMKGLTGKSPDDLVHYAWMDTSAYARMHMGDIHRAIDSLATASLLAPSAGIYQGGIGVLFEALNQATLTEGALFMGLSYLVLIVIMYLVSGSAWITLLTISVITMANICMFGTMALLGKSLNMVSLAVPPLVMVIGVANMIHISQHLRNKGKGAPLSPELFISSLKFISLPVLFTALSTAGGFLSLRSASMVITRDYGLMAATGVLFVFVFSLAAVLLVPGVFRKPRKKGRLGEGLNRRICSLMLWSAAKKFPVLASGVALALVFAFGITKIDVDTFTLEFLPGKHQAFLDNQELESRLGPYVPVEFIIETGESSPAEGTFMEALFDLERRLEEEKDIGSVLSIADFHFAFPDPTISERLMKESGFYDRMVADSGSSIRMTATASMMTAREFRDLSDRVLEIFGESMDPSLTIRKSGYLPLYSRIIGSVLRDQVRSLSLAFVVITLLVVLVLRSWRLSLLVIPANLLPLLMVLGVMGFSGMRLDISTVTIAATLFGIIVDDSMHILHRLKHHLAGKNTLQEALQRTGSETGYSIVLSSAVIASGYALLSTGSVPLIARTGLLMLLAIVLALLVDLILLPAMAAFLYRK